MPGGATSTTASTPFFSQNGTGPSVTKSFSAKGTWVLSWSYDCVNLGKKAGFSLVLRFGPGKETTVKHQEGLGGGGNHPYGEGAFSLSVTTECQWRVKGTK